MAEKATTLQERESSLSSPFLASIKERYRLNHPLSEKRTYHLVIDLQSSGIDYVIGDCLAVFPKNPPELVRDILNACHASGEEIVLDRKQNQIAFAEFLESANLLRVSRKLYSHLFPQLTPTKEDLERLHLLAILKMPTKNALIPQELCNFLAPLTPRFYSIASSQAVVGNEAHLTVSLSTLPDYLPVEYGTCSDFLCHRAPLNAPVIPIYHHSSPHFNLPMEAHSKPLIMIGPGTGIAPFRGFMQERIHHKASSKNWLFFGERHQKYDFYYSSYWDELVKKGQLQLDLAFSRDQEEKVYVQHKMLEKGKQIWEWLQDGYLFVCGDASKMAKDVEITLLEIFQKEGRMDLPSAKAYLKNLKSEKRYLRDVY